MSGSSLALIELLLVFGAVLAFGWYQLRDLKRYKNPPADTDDDA